MKKRHFVKGRRRCAYTWAELDPHNRKWFRITRNGYSRLRHSKWVWELKDFTVKANSPFARYFGHKITICRAAKREARLRHR